MAAIDHDSESSKSCAERIRHFIAAPVCTMTVGSHPIIPLEIVEKPKNSTSILFENGVRVIDKRGNHWFICMMESCCKFDNQTWIKITKSSTSNATTHLKAQHKVNSLKTLTASANLARITEQLDMSQKSFAQHPQRWFEVQLAAWAVEHSISFNSFQSHRFKLFAAKLPVGAGGMKSLNIRKLIVEQYCTVKQMIMKDMDAARAMFNDIPFMAINLDLYRNKFSNQKYIALRVSFNKGVEQKSYNVAIRRYAPTSEERSSQQASELLVVWMKAILKEFNVVAERDILSSATDSGSDVKRAMEVVFPTLREWCLSHVNHLSLADAFGTSVDPKKSKNKAARDVVQACRRVVESVNKSEGLTALFDEATREIFGCFLKLKNSPAHRWSAVDDVFVGLIQAWTALEQAFRRQQKTFFTATDKIVIIEFRSIVAAVRSVQILAQKMKSFVVVDVYLKMMGLYFTVLDPSAPLEMLEPTLRNAKDVLMKPKEDVPKDRVSRSAAELDSRTTGVRRLLREAMSSRFYNRYHPLRALHKPEDFFGHQAGSRRLLRTYYQSSDLRFSYLIDMQVLLCPGFGDGLLVKKMISSIEIDSLSIPSYWTEANLRSVHFIMVFEFMWKTIRRYAEIVAGNLMLKSSTGEPLQPPTAKRQRVEYQDESERILADLNLMDGDHGGPEETSGEKSVEAIVVVEIDHFKKLQRKVVGPEKFENLVAWWCEKPQRSTMPCLRQVAAAIHANKTSSGGLECDLGGMNDVLAAKRATLKPGLVEVVMFLKLNKEIIPIDPGEIIQLSHTWEDLVPTRPAIPSLDSEDDTEDVDDVRVAYGEGNASVEGNYGSLSHSHSELATWEMDNLDISTF